MGRTKHTVVLFSIASITVLLPGMAAASDLVGGSTSAVADVVGAQQVVDETSRDVAVAVNDAAGGATGAVNDATQDATGSVNDATGAVNDAAGSVNDAAGSVNDAAGSATGSVNDAAQGVSVAVNDATQGSTSAAVLSGAFATREAIARAYEGAAITDVSDSPTAETRMFATPVGFPLATEACGEACGQVSVRVVGLFGAEDSFVDSALSTIRSLAATGLALLAKIWAAVFIALLGVAFLELTRRTKRPEDVSASWGS